MEIYKKITNELKDKIAEDLKQLKIKDYLMAFDANSLYPSAMYDLNSEYPIASSARMISEEEKISFVELFNNQQFRPRTGIFKINYIYSPEKKLFFQPIPAKDKVGNTDLIRFRNGFIHDTLNSVDIQEIVKAGGEILKIHDGFIYEKNYEVSPFRSYVQKLFELRMKYKAEKNDVGERLIKLLLNSLYGKTVQRDYITTRHLWTTEYLRKNYTELIKSHEEIKEGLHFVEKLIEETEFKESNIKRKKKIQKKTKKIQRMRMKQTKKTQRMQYKQTQHH